MSFANRVATCATMILTAAAIIGAGTPGFAQQLDRAINAPVVASVPEVGVVQEADIKEPMANDELQDGDEVAYGTLDAAVAAQSVPDDMGDELQCMAGAIYFEAKGEPLSGQLAVAEVILNRSKSGHFPKSVCSVVTQPGQFSFVRGGHVPSVPSNRQYRTAIAVARVALADSWDSPASDAMYFHAKRAAPGWHRQQVAAIGNHVFYR
ncbi:cell wall hydrolase [Sphingomonas sp. PAMC 26621]|uniref:cell wall hydrolase n=1 Tax=Sphingomonas sp. PAMC 26621 TaxID=1112213 RepID=UPI000287E545|nr:cell wall hydrolase [Sphingomonas sp. PAMC 26621]